jgi:hypothetical protein
VYNSISAICGDTGILKAMEVSARESGKVGGDGAEALGNWRNRIPNRAVVLQLLSSH